MFLGHYAVALTAQRAVPRVSLGTLTFAVQFLDAPMARALDRVGRWGLLSVAVALLVIFFVSIFGTPPATRCALGSSIQPVAVRAVDGVGRPPSHARGS